MPITYKDDPFSSKGFSNIKMDNKVIRVLRTDQTHRYAGVTDDLIPLEEISPLENYQEEDETLPVLRMDGVQTAKNRFRYAHDFSKEFWQTYPFMYFLKKKDLLNGVVVAGGSIQELLTGELSEDDHRYREEFPDVDCFFYGQNMTPERATEIMTEIDAALRNFGYLVHGYVRSDQAITCLFQQDYYHSRNGLMVNGDWQRAVQANNTCYNELNKGPFRLQFVFRCYTSISEVIHGFDLGSSAVAFDPMTEKVYFTSLGKFAYEYGLNILDTTRRSTSYEARIKKYLDRGFGLLVPRLRIPKLAVGDYWTFTLPLVKIRVDDQLKIQSFDIANAVKVSDYYDLEHPKEKENQYDHELLNIFFYRLVMYHNHFYLSQDATKRLIIWNQQLAGALAGKLDMSEFLALRQERTLTAATKIREVLNSNSWASAYKEIGTVFGFMRLIGLANRPIAESVAYGMVEEHYSLWADRLTEFNAQRPKDINWIIKEPGTQVHGSINPIIEEEWKWYGNWYKPSDELLQRLKSISAGKDQNSQEMDNFQTLCGLIDKNTGSGGRVVQVDLTGVFDTEVDTFAAKPRSESNQIKILNQRIYELTLRLENMDSRLGALEESRQD